MVVALWPLPDSSTSTLMRTFYEVLCGEESVDVGDAMREAMRRTRDATPGEAHWGGLMVLGCGRIRIAEQGYRDRPVLGRRNGSCKR